MDADDIINESVLIDVALGQDALAANNKIREKAQCIQLVHQLDNPDAYAYAVNFHNARCNDEVIDDGERIAFTLRLDPPLSLKRSRDYVLIAEDLSAKAENEAWIPVGSLRVVVAEGKVKKAVVSALCSPGRSEHYETTCSLEVGRGGAVTNIALRASGNAIGLNHAID